MMVKTVNTCCRKYSLKKGCTIIGILTLVFSSLVLMGSLVGLQTFEDETATLLINYGDRYTPEQRQLFDIVCIGTRVALYVTIVTSVLNIIFSALLVYGTRKDNPSYVLPWVLEQLTILPINFLMSMTFIVVSFVWSQPVEGTYSLFLMIIHTAATLYWIIVVYSLYRQLRDRQGPNNFKNAV